MCFLGQLLFLFILLSYGCSDDNISDVNLPTNLHNDLSEKIGNTSLEILYYTAKEQKDDTNLILSPMTVWTLMSLIAEGASDDTLRQLVNALRIPKNRTASRVGFQTISKWLTVHTDTVDLEKVNAIFVDEQKFPLKDFQTVAKTYYDTQMISLNFSDNGEYLADSVNQAISRFTHGKIPKLVDSSTFADAEMILTSALYFKGQWTVPFNVTSTSRRPFYDSNSRLIGEVNMMYNRYNYPFANIKKMQARVIELPYGKENRLSMLIMLPYPNVSLEDMFLNFKKVPLDTIFAELRAAHEEYEDEEVDCFIPRFKIESSLVMTDILKTMGIRDLFNTAARLPYLARTLLYVSKVIHKAAIEVTETGTTAAAVTSAEFANRISVARFEANRPFSYAIIEKVTNSIVFGGIYRHPSLY